MSGATLTDDLLPDTTRRLHRALICSLIETGALPSSETLAANYGISTTELPHRLRDLEVADYLALDGTGRAMCVYPFSTVPTPHTVVINRLPR